MCIRDSDVNVRLLDNLSNEQNGRTAYVKPDEDIEEKVATLYSKIKNPVMTELRAEVKGFRLRDRHPDAPVSYTHLRAHETVLDLVCRLLLEKQKAELEERNNYHEQP